MSGDLDEMTLLSIPAEYVPIDYDMDPRVDDLIRGRALREGQIVVIEDLTLREDPTVSEGTDSPWRRARRNETARWCMVSDLVDNGNIVEFIGVYADGTKRSRRYNASYCWFVKKPIEVTR